MQEVRGQGHLQVERHTSVGSDESEDSQRGFEEERCCV